MSRHWFNGDIPPKRVIGNRTAHPKWRLLRQAVKGIREGRVEWPDHATLVGELHPTDTGRLRPSLLGPSPSEYKFPTTRKKVTPIPDDLFSDDLSDIEDADPIKNFEVEIWYGDGRNESGKERAKETAEEIRQFQQRWEKRQRRSTGCLLVHPNTIDQFKREADKYDFGEDLVFDPGEYMRQHGGDWSSLLYTIPVYETPSVEPGKVVDVPLVVWREAQKTLNPRVAVFQWHREENRDGDVQ